MTTGTSASQAAARRASRPRALASQAARRLHRFTESVIREQTRLALAHGAVNLAQGFPDFPCPRELKWLARDAIEKDHNQYSITWGLPGLRQAIARKAKIYNGIDVDAETEVTVTCGATEAMLCAFLGLIDAGREVVLFQPFYENYHPDSYLSGARPRYVTLRPPDWTFDEGELRRAFGPKTAAVVITTPHNPTGKVFTAAELEIISRLCQKWNARVFSDEIYEHILYDGARHRSPGAMAGLEDRTVTINSASKTYAVTGWRVGWALARKPLSEALRKVHDFLTVCAATPLQVAVQGALALPAAYYHELALEYRMRRELLIAGLESAGMRCFKPQGAYYVMAAAGSWLRSREDDAGLARRLVQEVGVSAVPGSSFYRSGPEARRDLLRFCFCKRDETLRAAVEKLRRVRPEPYPLS